MIAEVDSLDILVLVDNATDMLSSTPSHAESEGAGLIPRGAPPTSRFVLTKAETQSQERWIPACGRMN